MRRLVFCVVLLALFGAFGCHSAQAQGNSTRLRSGTLNWKLTGTPGEVEFRLIIAVRRDFFAGSAPDGFLAIGDTFTEDRGGTTFDFGDGDSVTPLRFRVNAYSLGLDNDTNGAFYDWAICEALNPGSDTPNVRHTYAGAGPFVADVTGQTRGATGSNRGQQPYQFETIVAPQSGNSSPVTTSFPMLSVDKGTAATFRVEARDPEGDKLRWRLATDREALGGSAPDAVTTDPTTGSPPNMTVDPVDGTVTWNNSTLDGVWFVQLMVEDVDTAGNVKSKVPVDFRIRISPNLEKLSVRADRAPIFTRPGQPVSFTVTGSFDNPDAQLTLNSSELPPGATMTPVLPFLGGATVKSTFNWTPTAAQAGVYMTAFAVLKGGQIATAFVPIFVDAIAPTIEFITPTDGATVKSLALIKGSILDNPGGSGNGAVLLLLQRKSDGKYWNPPTATWVAEPVAFTTTPTLTLTGNNFYRSVGLPSGDALQNGLYAITAKGADRAGNAISKTITVKVAKEVEQPLSVAITNPPNSAVIGSFPTIAGTAGGPVSKLTLTLRRNNDGKFWNGTAFETNVIYLKPTLTGANWTFASVPNGVALQSGPYTLMASAYNAAGARVSAVSYVTIKPEAVSLAITIPANGTTIKTLPAIRGTQSSLSRVNLAIRRFDNRYWNGASWGTTIAFLPTTLGVDGFSLTSGLPDGLGLPNGVYILSAYGIDAASRTKVVSNTVRVDNSTETGGGTTGSSVTASALTVSVADSLVRVVFTGALDYSVALDSGHYIVKVNGVARLVQNVFYSTSANTVLLKLGSGTLHSGDQVTVSYSGLRDSHGLALTVGQVGPATAN